MGAGFSLSRLPEIAPQLAAGAGISIGFEIFRRFVIARNRPASLKDGKDNQVKHQYLIDLKSTISILSTTTSWYLFSTHQFRRFFVFIISGKIPVRKIFLIISCKQYQEDLSNLGASGSYQEFATLFTYSYVWYDLFDMLRSNGFNPL